MPEFPAWDTATPPDSRRWLMAGAVLALLAGMAGGLASKADSGNIMVVALLLVLFLTGLLWICRLLYYRLSLHHESSWQQQIAQERRRWWQDHQRLLALREVVLIGPSGSETLDWVRVLGRMQHPPAEYSEPEGKALRIVRTFSADNTAREQQLARDLAMQWVQRPRDEIPKISHCFWMGSDDAWAVFSAQITAYLPGVHLPETPEAWLGEATLSRLTVLLREDAKSQHLVAGCISSPIFSDHPPYAGESAVLWLVTAEGPVVMPRGEFYIAGAGIPLNEVCERATKQCDLQDAPDACVLLSYPSRPEIADSGWNITHSLPDSYWGVIGEMEQLVVITLAAIYASQELQSCGWIAADPQYTLALGIVKPYGKG